MPEYFVNFINKDEAPPGIIAFQRVVADHLEVVFLPEPHRKSLRGALHGPSEQPRVTTSEQIEEAVMEAIAEQES